VSMLGLSTCICYSTPPNSLSFCGPDWENIKHYQRAKIVDASVKNHLTQYQTLFSYLSYIAGENNIFDQFDLEVVKAYWIGNKLLHNLDINRFYYHLRDTLNLKKRLKRSELEQLFGKLPQGALPNHSFHVLNVPWRTGHLPIEHTLDTLDQCRISWGKVTKVKRSELEVVSPRLEYDSVSLKLSEPKKHIVSYSTDEIKKGDLVSFHWGVLCEKLTDIDVGNLVYYTNIAIKLANEDIRTREHFS